jgi:hypothetical protein
MKVFRIEHPKTGRGPYQHHGYSTQRPRVYGQKMSEYAYGPHAPTPWDDGFDFAETDVFGFVSLHQLRSWFCRDVRVAIKRCGFVVSVYDVDPEYVKQGRKQCAFPGRCKPVGTLNLITLEEVSC